MTLRASIEATRTNDKVLSSYTYQQETRTFTSVVYLCEKKRVRLCERDDHPSYSGKFISLTEESWFVGGREVLIFFLFFLLLLGLW